jgi:hypothetical protein
MIPQLSNLKNINFVQAKEGWYKRIENNGWRPVSKKHLEQFNAEAYVTMDKTSKSTDFKPSKVLPNFIPHWRNFLYERNFVYENFFS